MAGFRCTDCIYSSFSFNEKAQKYQGACSRGYTLADPHVSRRPDMFFAERPSQLVPVVDPLGKEYLRTKNVCERFVHLPEVASKDVAPEEVPGSDIAGTGGPSSSGARAADASRRGR